MSTKRERITRLYLPGRPTGPPLSGGTKDSIRFFLTRRFFSPPLSPPRPSCPPARGPIGGIIGVCSSWMRPVCASWKGAMGGPTCCPWEPTETRVPHQTPPWLRARLTNPPPLLHHSPPPSSYLPFLFLVFIHPFFATAGPYGCFDWFHGFVESPLGSGRKIVTMTLYHDDRYTWSSLRGGNLNLAAIILLRELSRLIYVDLLLE